MFKRTSVPGARLVPGAFQAAGFPRGTPQLVGVHFVVYLFQAFQADSLITPGAAIDARLAASPVFSIKVSGTPGTESGSPDAAIISACSTSRRDRLEHAWNKPGAWNRTTPHA